MNPDSQLTTTTEEILPGKPDATTRAVDICVFTPSPLYTVMVERGADDEPEVHFHAGGQGFWIARMVNRLDARALLCAPLGGETGTVLRTLIEREGVALEAVPVRGWAGGPLPDPRRGARRTPAPVPAPPPAP